MPDVVVVGGGYGGAAAARALDDFADVTLVEPRDAFVHNLAALRAVVDPDWIDRLFIPYDALLVRGQVQRARAVRADPHGVVLETGERLAADYIVLATGSRYPFPAKPDFADSALSKRKLSEAHAALSQADSVLLLGAGPVGLEFAGEIKAAWPDKQVTVVDPVPAILGGDWPEEFRAELQRQLEAMGVELAIGALLRSELPHAAGTLNPFVATTSLGREIRADVWFRCFGVSPVSDYLAAPLSSATQPNGHIAVAADLRLANQTNVFAIGDITDIPEAKKAKAAGDHAEVVAQNIKALMNGTQELAEYRPGPPGISIPLGPSGGASYHPQRGLLDAETTSRAKGMALKLDDYLSLLRHDAPSPSRA